VSDDDELTGVKYSLVGSSAQLYVCQSMPSPHIRTAIYALLYLFLDCLKLQTPNG